MPSALVTKLRKQPEVRDAEALAAWIGRYKKLRKAGVSNKKATKLAGKPGGMKEGGVKLEDRKTGGRKKKEEASKIGKTRAEIEQYAKDNLVKLNADFEGVDPELARNVVEQLDKRLKEVPNLPDKLSTVRKSEGDFIMAANGNTLFIGEYYGSMESVGKSWDNSTRYEKKNGKPFASKSLFPRENASKITVDHELGHILHNQWDYNPNGKKYRREWKKLYEPARDNGEWPTDYSVMPPGKGYMPGSEAFAESVALYLNGREDLLPKGVAQFIKARLGL